MNEFDPELKALLLEIAPDDADRARLLEEHRQLEKDLLRLADPLPPPDFLSQVMTRVATEPKAMSRADVLSAVAIIGVTLSLAVAALLAGGGATGGFGLQLASLVVKLREGAVAFGSGLAVVWSTAALPLVIVLSLTLTAALAALRRFVQPRAAKVVS